jgi:hypothetical protein
MLNLSPLIDISILFFHTCLHKLKSGTQSNYYIIITHTLLFHARSFSFSAATRGHCASIYLILKGEVFPWFGPFKKFAPSRFNLSIRFVSFVRHKRGKHNELAVCTIQVKPTPQTNNRSASHTRQPRLAQTRSIHIVLK